MFRKVFCKVCGHAWLVIDTDGRRHWSRGCPACPARWTDAVRRPVENDLLRVDGVLVDLSVFRAAGPGR